MFLPLPSLCLKLTPFWRTSSGGTPSPKSVLGPKDIDVGVGAYKRVRIYGGNTWCLCMPSGETPHISILNTPPEARQRANGPDENAAMS
ncbi:hypothetical protein FIBSPDRAFT_297154 [Athelia psychrophila]|uniref:Uncharacterized protein n=1 Tax=Athelia psychrophila TaxID=1759441 RepID=A0A167X931_9AGAM|nr:hypothetical protein FIBSPDRAFT_297154 [Fibularhizoctonia sp. CBS 109695]